MHELAEDIVTWTRLNAEADTDAATAAVIPDPAMAQPPPGAPGPPPASQYQVLQYHGLPPSPPTLDVEFETCNVRAWEMAIKRYARARNITPAITGDNQGIDPSLYDRMCLEADSIIHPSITESAFTSGLSEDILELPPHALIQKVKDFCTSTITPSLQEALRHEANEIKIERDETIDDYIKRHKEHRRKMIRFQVPGVEHEASYVSTIIRGLSARPSLQSQISSLQLMALLLSLLYTLSFAKLHPFKNLSGPSVVAVAVAAVAAVVAAAAEARPCMTLVVSNLKTQAVLAVAAAVVAVAHVKSMLS